MVSLGEMVPSRNRDRGVDALQESGCLQEPNTAIEEDREWYENLQGTRRNSRAIQSHEMQHSTRFQAPRTLVCLN